MKVNDYGDMLEKVKGKKCIAFVRFGSYQGEWVAALDSGENIELWKGYYGSCSGCDWLEAERSWDTCEVEDEKAKEFFKEDRPFIEIPKETLMTMSKKDFSSIFPANVRKDMYDYNDEEMFNAIRIGLTN